MDGWKNAIKENESKPTKKVSLTIKKSEVKIKQALSKDKDVASIPPAFVLQADRKDGLRSSPEANVLGVHKDASTAPNIRSRPGGRSVDVCGPNAASSSGQLHTGKSISTAPKNSQPDPLTEPTIAAKPTPCIPASVIKFGSAAALDSASTSLPLENRNVPRPADERSPADPAAPTTPSRSSASGNRDVLLKPEYRSSNPDDLKSLSAVPTPAPRTATKDIPPKPARRSPITKRDAQSETVPTTGSSEPPNAPKPAPRSSASLRTSTSGPDDAARIESRSNHQFIADENVSIWSNSVVQLERPLSTSDNICRICHETDQVEPLISPCQCRGTLSLVHRTCLQHWLAESDSSSCELCRFMYITKRVPKYSILGSVVAWIKQNRRQRKALLLDTLGMIAFVPFATMITYVAAALADGIEYQESQPSWTDVTIRFAIVTFISLMTTIDVAYATYWMLRAQHHFSTWYSWYRRNSDVTLLPHP